MTSEETLQLSEFFPWHRADVEEQIVTVEGFVVMQKPQDPRLEDQSVMYKQNVYFYKLL